MSTKVDYVHLVYVVEMVGSANGRVTWRVEAVSQRNATLSLDAIMQAYELTVQLPNEGPRISFDMSVTRRHNELGLLWPSELDVTNWFAVGTERMFETGISGQIRLHVKAGEINS